MAYEQTEAVILEQLSLGNYKLSHSFHWLFGDLKLTIPKSGNRPKVSIDFSSVLWDEEKEQFISFPRSGEIGIKYTCLSTWWSSQRITLKGDELKDRLNTISVSYWGQETDKRRLEISKEDQSWAEKFRKAFE